MRELVPCRGCRRHVATTDTVCPFCASAMPVARPQRVIFAHRLGRAAMFSAVLAACESKPADPPPASAPVQGSAGAGSGSDDLEQLLDGDSRVVERAPPASAADAGVPVDAAVVAQTPADAGVAPDAGVDPAIAERKRKEAERRRREQLRLQRERELQEVQRMNHYERAKPYGAPPARRRVV